MQNTTENTEEIEDVQNNTNDVIPENETSELNNNAEPVENNELDFENKFNDINEKYMRLYAEFENFKRRTTKERIELFQTSTKDTIVALLPVLDDFERGLKAMEIATEIESVKEGVNLVYQKLNSILKSKGLEPIKAIGEPLNVDFHEAITKIPAPTEDLKGKIIDDLEKGYLLNGKIIRYTKVVIGE